MLSNFRGVFGSMSMTILRSIFLGQTSRRYFPYAGSSVGSILLLLSKLWIRLKNRLQCANPIVCAPTYTRVASDSCKWLLNLEKSETQRKTRKGGREGGQSLHNCRKKKKDEH